jgi:glutamate synthase domain-containing protein 2
MMSAGCIRARMCHGLGTHVCPIGLATQDINKRRSFLVFRNAKKIANYHKNLLLEIKTILAIMGIKKFSELRNNHILYLDKNDKIHQNMNSLFDYRLDEE